VWFGCRVGRRCFKLEITPYFEDVPPTWSVSIHRCGVARYLPIWTRSQASLVRMLDEILSEDERFKNPEWTAIPGPSLGREPYGRDRWPTHA
jgi:hypothetical protein